MKRGASGMRQGKGDNPRTGRKREEGEKLLYLNGKRRRAKRDWTHEGHKGQFQGGRKKVHNPGAAKIGGSSSARLTQKGIKAKISGGEGMCRGLLPGKGGASRPRRNARSNGLRQGESGGEGRGGHGIEREVRAQRKLRKKEAGGGSGRRGKTTPSGPEVQGKDSPYASRRERTGQGDKKLKRTR